MWLISQTIDVFTTQIIWTLFLDYDSDDPTSMPFFTYNDSCTAVAAFVKLSKL